ncbi:ABC transporter ATP-binding protein [Paenibacillus sp. GSMTC-2017]|uniref:ATP-binding cassette domain-containing protein n=1 Tax=Paenibacillus sp. GSMTC-2017 TaxID=2794350 RepID=UPI0018D643F3|nr:ABC transporter ATP-binding protein [Paenibacillus sp. GSMTC-2017]
MTLAIEVKNLTLRYGKTTALEDVSFKLAPGKIYGLLGRNGSGKTSLLSVLASFQLQSDGEVTISGEAPFESEKIMRQVCFIQESGNMQDGYYVRDALRFGADCWPEWDAEFANRLINLFELPLNKRIQTLSRGKRSALGVTIGLASRAPVTILDEAYLGMDAPSRYVFYDELLKDYLEYPRTFILSSHLIEEVGTLFEEVLILDKGKLMLHNEVETFKDRGVSITGQPKVVDEFTIGMSVIGTKQLGNTKSVTVYGVLNQEQRMEAVKSGLELGTVTLQDLFVHLTSGKVGQ